MDDSSCFDRQRCSSVLEGNIELYFMSKDTARPEWYIVNILPHCTYLVLCVKSVEGNSHYLFYHAGIGR